MASAHYYYLSTVMMATARLHELRLAVKTVLELYRIGGHLLLQERKHHCQPTRAVSCTVLTLHSYSSSVAYARGEHVLKQQQSALLRRRSGLGIAQAIAVRRPIHQSV